MDEFGESQVEEAFRRQVREVLQRDDVQAELDLLRRSSDPEADVRPLYGVLGHHGVLAVSWPREYGGGGGPPGHAVVVVEELMRCGVPDTMYVNGIQTVGQLILIAGTELLRSWALPRLARGELFASVLYTEPEAGSDLANVSTRARRHDAGFRLTGRKVFSLMTRFTDVGLCVARTSEGGSKYNGLSLFLVDLNAEGVTVVVVPSIAGEPFHEVTFSDAFVPEERLLGAEGEGWALITDALSLERCGLDAALRAARWFEAMLVDPDARTSLAAEAERVGRFGAMTEGARLLSRHTMTTVLAGSPDPLLPAMAKWYSSEVAGDIAEWNVLHGAPLPGRDAVRAYSEAMGLTLAGGTSEMMLAIIGSSTAPTSEI